MNDAETLIGLLRRYLKSHETDEGHEDRWIIREKLRERLEQYDADGVANAE